MKMRFSWMLALVCVALSAVAHGQGVLSQLFSGELVSPRTGVWAWYELVDAASGEKFYLRQAIVGEEKAGRKPGYWLEVQIRPQVGFPTTYKMLLTGPASDPANIRKLYFQNGNDPVQLIEPGDLEPQETAEAQPAPLSQQTIETPNGPIACNYYKLADGTELWLSDAVAPMGLVRLVSPEGELKLQRFGEGGPDAASTLITDEDREATNSRAKEKGKKTEASPAEAAPGAAPERAAQPEDEKPRKKNFGGRNKRN